MAAADLAAWGSGVRILATEPDALQGLRTLIAAELDAVDLACSRFRDDSELARANARAGTEVEIGPLLAEYIAEALRVADMTAGAVDPTVGEALSRIGYDRDFALVPALGSEIHLRRHPAGGWRSVSLDVERGRLRVPAGSQLDLGSSAKALAADRCAGRAHSATGAGVLVSLGGDIAMAGAAPPGGWGVLVTDDHAAPASAGGQVVSLSCGGLATSSTTVRRWHRGRTALHHIVDPATGLPARECWRTVSVFAASCVDANAAATASIVWGETAPEWLEAHRLPARLVAPDGSITRVAGWPEGGEQ
ncbi:MAG: FAD:protein FMN transferase [Candidatus Dormibacteraeota bacterium]|nr:FAD:protein FMN transferase [Candidatus Dormibacteraeota bacterium]